jgi:Notch-like protein
MIVNVYRVLRVINVKQQLIFVQVFLVKIMVNSLNILSKIDFVFFCSIKGTCINNIESYSCICSIGWTGSLCEVNINECSFPLSCHPNSTCIDLPGSYQCLCPSWLTGVNCLTAIDQCQTYPCLNNGVCVNNYGSLPTCYCQSGYTGVYCEVRN